MHTTLYYRACMAISFFPYLVFSANFVFKRYCHLTNPLPNSQGNNKNLSVVSCDS